MQYIPLPPDADDATRLSYSAFALALANNAMIAAAGHINPEAHKMLIEPIADMYGGEETPAAQWIMRSLKPQT
jgi:hypothetical protein